MKLNVIIFDMNNLEIEKEEEYELLDFLSEEVDLNNSAQECNNHLQVLGLELCGLKIHLINSKKFVWHIINKLFKGFKIYFINKNRFEKGHPDYILQKGEEKIYLELKLCEDSLRTTQLKWFIDNKEKNNKVLVLSWDEDFAPKNNSSYI